jgi:hypothetical protein
MAKTPRAVVNDLRVRQVDDSIAEIPGPEAEICRVFDREKESVVIAAKAPIQIRPDHQGRARHEGYLSLHESLRTIVPPAQKPTGYSSPNDHM